MRTLYIFISLLQLVPLYIGLYRFKKLDKNLKLIFYLVLIGILISFSMIYFGMTYRFNSWLMHIYTIVEFILISYFYYRLFSQKIFRTIILILFGIFSVIVILNKIFLETFDKIDNYTLTIESIIILIITSMFLVDYLIKHLIVNIRDYRILLTIGYMIYFGGNLFIFTLSNEVSGIWIVHNIIYILLVAIYSFVFAV